MTEHLKIRSPLSMTRGNCTNLRRVIFVMVKSNFSYFSNSICVVKSFPLRHPHDPPEILSETWKEGLFRWRRVRSTELTSECVLTTPSRSLVHKHCSFNHTQDRHVYLCVWNCSPSFCRTIWLDFVHSSWTCVCKEGRNTHCEDVLICVCHRQTCSNKKTYSYMNWRTHTRNEERFPEKNAFLDVTRPV